MLTKSHFVPVNVVKDRSNIALQNATYLSADEVERAEAFAVGYERICQHPSEVGVLGAGDILVVDGNLFQLHEVDAAIRLISELVQRRVPVGIHAYELPSMFTALLREPLVVMAKTQHEVIRKLRRITTITPPKPVPTLPSAVPIDAFPPSPQLGAALKRMAEQKHAIERHKAEELARLRAIQDRD